MNAGYVSLLCLFIVYVLYWIGSLQPIMAGIRVPPLLFLAVMTASYPLSGYMLPLNSSVSMSWSYILVGIGFFLLWAREPASMRAQLFMSAILVGVSLFLLLYVLYLDPILQFMGQTYFVAGASLILTLILVRTLAESLIVTGLGLIVMEICYGVWEYSVAGVLQAGDFQFTDRLLLSLLVSVSGKVLFNIVLECLVAARKVLVRRSR